MHACELNCAKCQYGIVAQLKLRLIREGCLGMRLLCSCKDDVM